MKADKATMATMLSSAAQGKWDLKQFARSFSSVGRTVRDTIETGAQGLLKAGMPAYPVTKEEKHG